MGCCISIKHELLHASMYDLSERVSSTEPSTKTLDIKNIFAPRPQWLFIGIKFACAAWLLASLVVATLEYNPTPEYFYVYLSAWGFVFTVLYFICSFLTAAVLACHQRGQNEDAMTGKSGILIKTTWSLFSLAFPFELVITVLFWVLVYDGGAVDYTGLILHGIAWIVIGIDGILINRIPMKMKQFIFCETIAICYTVWSVLHSVLNVGTPYDEEGEDGPIYDAVDWKNDTGFAVGLALALLFIGNPIVYLFCRALSRALPMRYICNDDGVKTHIDEETLEVSTK